MKRHIRFSHKANSWQVQDKYDRTKWRAIRPTLMYMYKAIGFTKAATEPLPSQLRFNHKTGTWQILSSGGWVTVDTKDARRFFDEGLSVGCKS